MSSNSNTSYGGGVGFAGLLAILFIGLKLGGVIGWSWLWVLSPLWIPFALVVAVLLIVGLLKLAFVWIPDALRAKRRGDYRPGR